MNFVYLVPWQLLHTKKERKWLRCMEWLESHEMFNMLLFWLQVKIWFQNRRTKWKKQHPGMDVNCGTVPSPPTSGMCPPYPPPPHLFPPSSSSDLGFYPGAHHHSFPFFSLGGPSPAPCPPGTNVDLPSSPKGSTPGPTPSLASYLLHQQSVVAAAAAKAANAVASMAGGQGGRGDDYSTST